MTLEREQRYMAGALMVGMVIGAVAAWLPVHFYLLPKWKEAQAESARVLDESRRALDDCRRWYR